VAKQKQVVDMLKQQWSEISSSASQPASASVSSSSVGGKQPATSTAVVAPFSNLFCYGDNNWCYREPPEAPPLPPADNDDLSWLESELSSKALPLRYADVAASTQDAAPIRFDITDAEVDSAIEKLAADDTPSDGDGSFSAPSFLFVASAGRTGTRFMRDALGAATNVTCYHPSSAIGHPLVSNTSKHLSCSL
jgi:hypothetical protein